MFRSGNESNRYGVVLGASVLCVMFVFFVVSVSGCGGKDNGGGGEEECGNGVVDVNEQCDGTDLNGRICQDLGNYTGGTLVCNADCTFDTSMCTVPTDCGNGVIDGDEECDGSDLGGVTCGDLGDFSGGTLSCEDNCSFNTSGCISETQVCPREDLGSDTSIHYNGDTTGLPNLVTSSRLEWQDAPDDSLLFTAPSAGEYEIVVTDEPSGNGGCGASVWDYTTDEYYDESWCPDSGSTTELDGYYATSGYPYYFEEGETVLIWFSCTYWADVQSGPYTLIIEKQ